MQRVELAEVLAAVDRRCLVRGAHAEAMLVAQVGGLDNCLVLSVGREEVLAKRRLACVLSPVYLSQLRGIGDGCCRGGRVMSRRRVRGGGGGG